MGIFGRNGSSEKRRADLPNGIDENLGVAAGRPKIPEGVPSNFHPLWVHPSLARELHEFYGPKGHVIPHDFAPVHARLTGEAASDLPADNARQS